MKSFPRLTLTLGALLLFAFSAPATASAEVTSPSPYFWGVPCQASADFKRLSCKSISSNWQWIGKTYCYNTNNFKEAIFIQAAANKKARHARWKIYKGQPQWHTVVKPVGWKTYPYGICDSWRAGRS